MKDIRRMCECFLKTPWRFLLWKDVIEWISNEKLHLCEQGLKCQTSCFLTIAATVGFLKNP